MVKTDKVVQGLLLLKSYLDGSGEGDETEVRLIACRTLCEIEKAGLNLERYTISILEAIAEGHINGWSKEQKEKVKTYLGGLAEHLRKASLPPAGSVPARP